MTRVFWLRPSDWNACNQISFRGNNLKLITRPCVALGKARSAPESIAEPDPQMISSVLPLQEI
jgi:hypothetical protein